MSNLKERLIGRDEGMVFSLKILREAGIDAKPLEDEIRFRGLTGVKLLVTEKELSEGMAQMKDSLWQTMRVAFIAVLHDVFGMGKKRAQKAIDAFDKLCAYMFHGWLYWYDLIEEIRNRLGLELETSAINEANLGIRYAHADDVDMLDEPPAVYPAAWQGALDVVHFTDEEDPDDKGEHVLLDQNGHPIFRYYVGEEQARMFDFLLGAAWGRDHDWSKEDEQKKEKPQQPPQPKPQTKKRRRKKR